MNSFSISEKFHMKGIRRNSERFLLYASGVSLLISLHSGAGQSPKGNRYHVLFAGVCRLFCHIPHSTKHEAALKILSPQKRFLGLRRLLKLRYWQAIVPDSLFLRTKFKLQQ